MGLTAIMTGLGARGRNSVKHGKEWVAKVGAIILAVVAVAFVLAIVTSDSKIVVTPYESTAVAASGERLIQMAQWTIGTILTVGALLIGLNWYQNEHRYERDKQDLRDEIRQLRQDAERRLDGLDSSVNAQLGMWMHDAVVRELGSLTDMDAARRAVQLYRVSDDIRKRSAVASVIIGMARSAASAPVTTILHGHLDVLATAVGDIRRDFPRDADFLQSIIEGGLASRDPKATYGPEPTPI